MRDREKIIDHEIENGIWHGERIIYSRIENGKENGIENLIGNFIENG